MSYELPIDQPFDLALTIRCGQGHRWRKDDKNPGWYTGVLGSDFVGIRQRNGADGPVEFRTGGNAAKAKEKLRSQFRMDDDVAKIYRQLRDTDWKMNELVSAYTGLRVMSVCPWECLVFFTLTSNITDIPRVHRLMELLGEKFGNSIGPVDQQRYTFPAATAVVGAGGSKLAKSSSRLKILVEKRNSIAPQVVSGGIKADSLRRASYGAAIKELGSLWQVGPKKADCVALFSLDKLEAFPVDVHIRRASEDLYGGASGFPVPDPGQTYDQRIRDWARAKFGAYAGYASQFLFIHNYENWRKRS